jgi:glutathione reductase (NADPH)
MSSYDYDLFVMGAGSGGVRASRMSAGYGARVAVAEDRYLGGTCVNVGCVPKKLFVYGSHFAEDFEDARAYGWQDRTPERHLSESVGWSRCRDHRWYGSPDRPPHDRDQWAFRDRRERSGGDGHLAFCARISRSRARHHLQRSVLPGDVSGACRGGGPEELRKKDIGLCFDARVERDEKSADAELRVHLDDGRSVETDLVLYATGRRPKVDGLGLEAAGVTLAPGGGVQVDNHYRTNVDNIYAIGDVIDRVQLTPVAIAEGMCIAENLFNGGNRTVDYDAIPTAVFCQPNIGTVGPTEEEARLQYPQLRVFESTFRPMKHTLTGRDDRTMMKLLVDGASDRVVAAHMVGPDAGEIIQGLGVALKAGATKAQFDATIGIHPTAAEEFVTLREPAR